MVSEFGSALNERSELDCFTSITDYFTSSGLANDGRHAPIQSWFYWCAATLALLVQGFHSYKVAEPTNLLLMAPPLMVNSCLPQRYLPVALADGARALGRPVAQESSRER